MVNGKVGNGKFSNLLLILILGTMIAGMSFLYVDKATKESVSRNEASITSLEFALRDLVESTRALAFRACLRDSPSNEDQCLSIFLRNNRGGK